ncbi:MAG: PLP-dependent aminotransferase family protein [Ahrensia sp.]|nr:PLP-dependent aminotransferase family protein [Ahrensia sp.]
MRDFLITLDRGDKKSLQAQLREVLVSAILAGHLRASEKLPSTRHLSRQLGISRNTAVIVYQGLVEDGYLRTSERSGYFVNEIVQEMGIGAARHMELDEERRLRPRQTVDWQVRLRVRPTAQRNIHKPLNWRQLPYPFIYGQPDPTLFPISDWRDCAYRAMGRKWLDEWSQDTQDNDDEMLVDEIRSRILPRRGILAGEDQILVTLGAQQAIYMLASLLVSRSTEVALEEPGYPDARNIFALRSETIRTIDVDEQGLPVDERLDGTQILYTTPSHQLPTTVTMPPQRRKALLEKARQQDFLIVEDDYELEANYVGDPLPALKAHDSDGRVIYLGSFSKTLFPGLRLGFIVADAELIKELRALRRLMVRHPPVNNQRSTAFFLSLGFYDVFVRRLHRTYRERWTLMREALQAEFPDATVTHAMGGSSYWVDFAGGQLSDFDSERLATLALEKGVLIEPGGIYSHQARSKSCARLGFSSIATDRIEEGLARLRHVMDAN